jgi:hypothetical protein
MKIIRAVGWALLALTAAACMPSGGSQSAASSSSVTPDPRGGEGWRDLQSLGAWRGYRSQEIPTGWRMADGLITKDGVAQDLVSREQYGNFELSLDWMIASGGNAGIFYRATEEYDHIYWSGPEYQLLDDARAPDGRNRLTSAAAAYGFYAAPAGVLRPAGEWNSTRIIARGPHIEHWMNDQKVVEYEIGSPDWTAKMKASKFKDWPNFARSQRGYIGIQGDHNGRLSLRNMKIRELP